VLPAWTHMAGPRRNPRRAPATGSNLRASRLEGRTSDSGGPAARRRRRRPQILLALVVWLGLFVSGLTLSEVVRQWMGAKPPQCVVVAAAADG